MAPPKVPAIERFEANYKVLPSGCWQWTASIRANGYSQFRDGHGYGHRFAYEHFRGPVPKDRHLHHVCGNRACVNPAHLELVTPREHFVERHNGFAHRNAEKTHCNRGHPLSGDNLYVYSNGKRSCRTCMDLWRDEHREERRAYARAYYLARRRVKTPRS